MYECNVIPTFYLTEEREARKQYRCCECHAAIEKGEVHLYIAGRWSSGFETFRQHLACQHCCEYIRDHLEDECIPFGELLNWWKEYRHDSIENKSHVDWVNFRKLMVVVLRRCRKSRM